MEKFLTKLLFLFIYYFITSFTVSPTLVILILGRNRNFSILATKSQKNLNLT